MPKVRYLSYATILALLTIGPCHFWAGHDSDILDGFRLGKQWHWRFGNGGLEIVRICARSLDFAR